MSLSSFRCGKSHRCSRVSNAIHLALVSDSERSADLAAPRGGGCNYAPPNPGVPLVVPGAPKARVVVLRSHDDNGKMLMEYLSRIAGGSSDSDDQSPCGNRADRACKRPGRSKIVRLDDLKGWDEIDSDRRVAVIS